MRTDLTWTILVGAAYFLTAKLSLHLALVHQQVTPVWPPTGIALVSLLLLGRRVWPGIAVAAFLVNLPIGPSPIAAAVIATGNTAAPLLSAYLLQKVGFRRELDRLRDALAIVVLGGLCGMLLSATVGATVLVLSGAVARADYWATWSVWWAGDAMGVLLVAPFLLTWRLPRGPLRQPMSWRRGVEAALMLAGTAVVTKAVFRSSLRLEYLVFPFLGWAAWRFRHRGAAPAALVASGIAIWAAIEGTGPFTTTSLLDKMVTLQSFNSSVALASLVLASMATQRLRVRESLERSAVDLEHRVRLRTEQLSAANELLGREIDERSRIADELRNVGGRLAEAQQIAHIGSWDWEIAADAVTWSDELYRIWGVEPTGAAATYQDYLQRVHPDDRDLADSTVRRAFSEPGAFSFDHRVIRSDGDVRWVHSRGELTVGADGAPIRMTGTAQDITVRKLAEERALASRKELREYIDNLSTFTAKLGLDGSILYAGRAAELASGLSREDLMHTHFLDGTWFAFDPEVRARVAEAFRRACSGEAVSYDEQICVFGRVLSISFGLSPVRDEHGDVSYVVAEGRDITAQKKAEARLQRLLEAAPDAMVGVDDSGIIRLVNRQAELLFDYDRTELIGEPIETLVPERFRAVHPTHRGGYLAAPRTRPMGAGLELAARRRDGTEFPVDISLSTAETEEGPLVTAAVRDITERKHAEKALLRAEKQFRSAFDNAPIGIALTSLDGRVFQVNRALCELLGLAEGDLLGSTLEAATHPDVAMSPGIPERILTGELATYRGERTFVHSDGHLVWALVSIALLADTDGLPLYFIAHVEDVSAAKEAEKRLLHQALHDELTGLPNRKLLMDRLDQALARAQRQSSRVAVLFLDLDNFKLVNDSIGHNVGDQTLVVVADRIQAVLRREDFAARFGGDEFVVLCEDLVTGDEAVDVADRLADAIGEPFEVDGREIRLSASVGIALAGGVGIGPADVLRDADVAMYRAKEQGRARYEVFDEALRRRVVRRLEIEADLRRAIDRGEFRVVYQPQVSLETGEVAGFEALARWDHPDRGLVYPSEFIPVAEDTGLIVPLGALVLETACREAGAWPRAQSGRAPMVAVNLSSRQLTEPGLVEAVSGVLADTGVDPATVCLELTESALAVGSDSALHALQALRDLGMLLGIDDFGTGYSSLTYVSQFHPDLLKVDRSFIELLGIDSESSAIVEAVIGLAHSLGLVAIAEGVETQDQRRRLRELGCDLAQGYLFGCPESPEVTRRFASEGVVDLRAVAPDEAGINTRSWDTPPTTTSPQRT